MTRRLAPSAETWCAICDTVKPAFGRLAAGHRHRVVIEDLVGDVDAGSRRRADRQQAGMGVGAVAEILEHVLFAGERRLPDPGDAFRAHMRDRLRCGGSAPTAPCRDSRCRPWRGCPRGSWSRCCAGSPSRNTACAAALRRRRLPPAGRRLRVLRGAAPAPGCDGRACASRATTAAATMVGVNSPSLGNSSAPVSSRLPTTEGRFDASTL